MNEKIKICGLQRLTLLDFPGEIACTVFLGGCNFRCPFCHNASLVDPQRIEKLISEDDFFAFLDSRVGKLGGVCISGGEPTVYPEVYSFIKRIKEKGFKVKLDTNGTSPELIERLISDSLLDYIAMDIKSSKEGYQKAIGKSDFDISLIERSVSIIMSSDLNYEFRTTLVRGIHSPEDMRAIGQWIRGAKRYFLQSFRDSGDILTEGCSALDSAALKAYLSIACEYIPTAELRGE